MFINMMNRTRIEKKDNIWSMFVVDVFCFGSIRKHFFAIRRRRRRRNRC